MAKLSDLMDVSIATEQMLELAKSEQWETLNDLESQRQAMLKQIFPIDEAENSPAFFAELERLNVLHQQLEQQCMQKKFALQSELQGFNKNKKAIQAYQVK